MRIRLPLRIRLRQRMRSPIAAPATVPATESVADAAAASEAAPAAVDRENGKISVRRAMTFGIRKSDFGTGLQSVGQAGRRSCWCADENGLETAPDDEVAISCDSDG